MQTASRAEKIFNVKLKENFCGCGVKLGNNLVKVGTKEGPDGGHVPTSAAALVT